MKVKCTIIISLIVIMLTCIFSLNFSAITTGFKVETVESEKAVKILDALNLCFEKEEFSFHSIKCFDISDGGLIAIGIDEDTEKHINIYDNNGTFQYGYSFENQGTYGIEFDKDNLIIYTVRGQMAYLLDNKGNCLEVFEICETSENNSYWQHNVYAKSKSVGNSKYILSKPIIFSPSYTKLTKISSDGSEFVIIDVSTDFFVFVIIVIIIAIIIMGISIIATIKYFKTR